MGKWVKNRLVHCSDSLPERVHIGGDVSKLETSPFFLNRDRDYHDSGKTINGELESANGRSNIKERSLLIQ